MSITEEETQLGDSKLAEELDAIEPRGAHRKQRIGPQSGVHEYYVQKPLSFFGKMQFFEVLGRAVDTAMAGDNGLTLGSLFGGSPKMITPGGEVTFENLNDADVFVKGIAKLSSYAPELITELYCIFLGIPQGDRPWAREAMQKSEEDGGLSDDDGVEILETFIDQNGEAMRAFFVDKLQPLLARARNRFGLDGVSASSKPSSPTRQSTQSG